MPKFNPYEERILRTLVKSRRKLTTSKLSDFTGISYNTTKSYLKKLGKKNIVKKKDKGNRIYWWL